MKDRKNFWEAVKLPLLAILISLLFGAVVILILGKNPLKAYAALLQGSGILSKGNYAGGTGQITDFFIFLDATAPMLFAALAVTLALKGGLFNIGVAGQMMLSAFIASYFLGQAELSPWIAKPLVLLTGIAVGGALGALVGFLKARFNINEVVSTIMFNYIVQYLTSYFIFTSFIDPVSRQSIYIRPEASLTWKGVLIDGLRFDLSLGIVLALIAALLLHRFIHRTKEGFEIQMVGKNKLGAEYAGVNVPRTIIRTMAMSGALAGLAGVVYYLGYVQSIQPRVLGSLGYDAIATALLGAAHPIGVIFSSFLVTILDRGSVFMSSRMGIVKEIAGVLTSIILIFSAVSGYIGIKMAERKSAKTLKKEGK